MFIIDYTFWKKSWSTSFCIEDRKFWRQWGKMYYLHFVSLFSWTVLLETILIWIWLNPCKKCHNVFSEHFWDQTCLPAIQSVFTWSRAQKRRTAHMLFWNRRLTPCCHAFLIDPLQGMTFNWRHHLRMFFLNKLFG